MMIGIKGFSFQYQTEESLEFNTPEDAIKFFNSKGWGMHNFVIRVKLDYNLSFEIDLEEFNTLTDHWFEY